MRKKNIGLMVKLLCFQAVLYSGILVPTFLVKPWSVITVDVCVMGLLLKKDIIMICSWKEGTCNDDDDSGSGNDDDIVR